MADGRNRLFTPARAIPGIEISAPSTRPSSLPPAPAHLPISPRMSIQLSTSHEGGGKDRSLTFANLEAGKSYIFQDGGTTATLTISTTPQTAFGSSPSHGSSFPPPPSLSHTPDDPASLLLIHTEIPPEQPQLVINSEAGDVQPAANATGDPANILLIHRDIPEERQPHVIIPIADERDRANAARTQGRSETEPVAASRRGDDEYVITITDHTRPVDLESGLNEEETPLLGSKNQGWCSWATSGLKNAAYKYTVAPVVNGASYVKAHPAVATTAVITAATPALTALANPAGITPDKIGAAWWNNMSNLTRLHSITNCVSSLSINAIMNAFFLPTFWGDFKEDISHTFDGPGEFTDNLLAIFLAVGGAVAQAAIAYNSFLWLPAGMIAASIPAFISFSVTLASRYIGVKGLFKQIHNLFNDDAKAQAEFSDALDHIDEKYLSALQLEFSSITATIPERRRQARASLPGEYQRKADERGGKPGTPLNAKEQSDLNKALAEAADDAPISKKEYEYIEEQIAEAMTRLLDQYPDLIKDKTCCEYLTKYSFALFKVSFAFVLIGAPYFLTFMQKGVDGVNTLAKFAGTDLAGLNAWIKRLIGLAPGLASGALAFNSACKLPDTIIQLIHHLFAKPSDIPFAVPVIVANGFAASGPQNVALGITRNKDNVIGFHDGEPGSTTYVLTTALAGGVINTNASIGKAFGKDKPTLETVTLRDVKDHVRNVDAHPVHHDTADSFRDFLGDMKHKKHLTVADDVDMRRNKSEYSLIV